MQRIVIINTKGGCGKTTLSTNLASLYASRGYNTALYDYDPQLSSMRWAQTREQEEDLADIYVVATNAKSKAVTKSWQMRIPPGTERVIVDAPPGLKGPELAEQLKGANVILIPVLASLIDMYATADFIRDLLLGADIRRNKVRIGIIANRIKKNTQSFGVLQRFLNTLSIPLVAQLRDTQNYVRATDAGLGIHELKKQPTIVDNVHWNIIYKWLENEEVEEG